MNNLPQSNEQFNNFPFLTVGVRLVVGSVPTGFCYAGSIGKTVCPGECVREGRTEDGRRSAGERRAGVARKTPTDAYIEVLLCRISM